MATLDLTEPEFAGVIENNKIVILDFWAEWCGPCKAYGPVYERVSNEFDDVIFAKINTEEEPELGRMFNIRSIPTTYCIQRTDWCFYATRCAARGCLARFGSDAQGFGYGRSKARDGIHEGRRF